MWNLLKRSKEECRRLGGAVEEAAAKQADAVSVKNLTEALTPDERTHMATCQDCARGPGGFSGEAALSGRRQLAPGRKAVVCGARDGGYRGARKRTCRARDGVDGVSAFCIAAHMGCGRRFASEHDLVL